MKPYPFQTRSFANWCGIAAVGAALVCSLPSGTRAAELKDHNTLRRVDRGFIEKIARSSLEEIEMSRVAADRTTNPQVREFAQSMVSDHGAVNEDLVALASAKGVSLPAKDTTADRWAKKGAKSFDADYLKKMVSDHESTVKAFEDEAKNGEDPEVVAFARKYLPKLQAHLEHAVDLKKRFK
jgi:putative membrane protein